MRRLGLIFAAAITIVVSTGWAQQTPATGPYKVLRTAKVGGVGGFDYVFADADARR